MTNAIDSVVERFDADITSVFGRLGHHFARRTSDTSWTVYYTEAEGSQTDTWPVATVTADGAVTLVG